jgi:outer membrane protein OmpA-like peptidoglycan-associated protein
MLARACAILSCEVLLLVMIACGTRSPTIVSDSPSPKPSAQQTPTSEMPGTTEDNRSFGVGDVFIGVADGKIQWRRPDGTLIRILATGKEGDITGMAFDPRGNLYATEFTEGEISKFDTRGNLIGRFGDDYDCDPESIVFDRAGNVYVGQAGCGRKVLKFDSEGKLLGTFVVATGSKGSDWLDLAADQCTLYYTSEDRTIRRFDVCSNSQLPNLVLSTQTTPGNTSYALRILAGGGLLLANEHFVVRFDDRGQMLRLYGTGDDFKDENDFFALNLDPDGRSFWTAGLKSHNIYKFNIDTGELLFKFNAGSASDTGADVGGLAIFGEIAISSNTTQVTQEQSKIRVTLDSAILFDFNRSELKPDAQTALASIKTTLIDKHPRAKLVIEGHTDDVGTEEYNLTLSKQRAQSVAEWLRLNGIDASRLEISGYGKSRPKYSNTSEEDRARNRRVEIVIID